MNYVVFFTCCTIKILISNRPLKLKFGQCLQPEKTCQLLLTFLTTVMRWSRSTSNFCALIDQYLTGECMRKTYTACVWKLVYFDSWSWQSFVSTCDVFFHWVYKVKFSCYQDCYSWLICLLGFWLRNRSLVKVGNPISQWHRFQFSPCLMRKRVEKSEVILALLDSFQCISNGKPE